MSERDIILEDLSQPQNLFRLAEYIRELYRYVDARFSKVAYATSVEFDADESDAFLVELTGNITGITLKNAYKGRKVTILFKQDSSGSRTVSGWASNVKLAGAAAIGNDNADEYSTITLIYDDTNWVEIGRTSDVK